MNYVDLLLVLILLFSIWVGYKKGFIIGSIELVSWLGGLIATFYLYPFVVIFFEKYLPGTGTWTVLISFLITLVLVRIAFALATKKLLQLVPRTLHQSIGNRGLGIIPGILNGILLAIIATALLIMLPISKGMSNEAKDSVFASRLSTSLEKFESKFGPVLENVNRSISKVVTNPGSDKLIKLPFKTNEAKPRADLEAKMLEMVNKERKAEGLKPLKADPQITPVARKHSDDMLSRGYFSHISPEGATPFDRLREGKINFMTAGENLALAQTLQQAHTGLMNSPGHRANILHTSFGRLGIGILDADVNGLMVTQNFRN